MPSIRGFPVRKQKDPYTCGLSSLGSLVSFLGKRRVEEGELPSGFWAARLKAFLPSRFIGMFRDYVSDYSIELTNPTREEIPGIFSRQLRDGLPVPILYSTRNVLDRERPVYIHYSTVIGIDDRRENVTLANPFGYEEKLRTGDLLDMMEYRNYKDRPVKVRLALLLGVIKRNSVFMIRKS